MCGEGDSPGIVQEIKIWLYNQRLNVQTRNCPRILDASNFQGFWDTNRLVNPG